MTLRLRPQVVEDLAYARDWYEARRVGLGTEFMLAVDQLLVRVDQSPAQFPMVRGDVRRALLRRFPYALFFIDEAHIDTRVVLAVLHQAMNPKRWPK